MGLHQDAIETGVAVSGKATVLASAGSIWAGLTLNDIGCIVGIAGVIIGIIVNITFRYLSYRLEKKKAGL